jgi:hypothetical protein
VNDMFHKANGLITGLIHGLVHAGYVSESGHSYGLAAPAASCHTAGSAVVGRASEAGSRLLLRREEAGAADRQQRAGSDTRGLTVTPHGDVLGEGRGERACGDSAYQREWGEENDRVAPSARPR